MDDDFDLRPYLLAAGKFWRWIALAGVLAGLLAFGVTSLLPPIYEATTLVTITDPRQVLQFDPRIESAVDRQPREAYPQLATSDEVLRRVLEQAELPAGSIETVQDLRRAVDASAGSDPSIILLAARLDDADLAADLANLWAAIFVEWANDVFGDQGGEQVVFFERQLAAAAEELEAAEQALVAFEARNRADILSGRLDALLDRQAAFLRSLNQIAILTTDIESLRQLTAAGQQENTVTFADQLSVLLLQLQTFNATPESALQLDLSPTDSITFETPAQQEAWLGELLAALRSKENEIERHLAELEPLVLVSQEEREQILAEQAFLTRERAVAEEAFIALARKVEEEKITSQDDTSGVRLASRAAVPDEKVAPRRLLTSALAGGAALVLALMSVFILTWWQTARND